MCTKRSRCFVTIGSLAWVGCFTVAVAAQEISAPNRVLRRSHLATKTTFVAISTTFANVFDPTTIGCPGAAGTTCTVRVEVSAVLRDIACCGHAADGRVLVDGVPAAPGGESTLQGTTSDDATVTAGDARTFTWVAIGATPGIPVVDVQFRASAAAAAVDRSLTIDVYKP